MSLLLEEGYKRIQTPYKPAAETLATLELF
jgi:hypothetical protein